MFLDYNPDYWCFVPMKSIEVNLANATNQRASPSSRQTNEICWTRTDEEVRLLVANLPKPPLGFDFSYQQRQQQRHFFKGKKDYIVPFDNVDLYNADIITICIILPRTLILIYSCIF